MRPPPTPPEPYEDHEDFLSTKLVISDYDKKVTSIIVEDIENSPMGYVPYFDLSFSSEENNIHEEIRRKDI
jgi:hypothetical protein